MNGDKSMTLTNKIIVLICLMGGTAMFIHGLDELLYNVGAVYILSYTVAILMFCVGIRLITKVEDSTNGRRRII
jgi:hypothetical protein|tara:strand:+ start:24 stop:245 length:222 start_codon:yes stop_codon:yes gene_type:complete